MVYDVVVVGCCMMYMEYIYTDVVCGCVCCVALYFKLVTKLLIYRTVQKSAFFTRTNNKKNYTHSTPSRKHDVSTVSHNQKISFSPPKEKRD